MVFIIFCVLNLYSYCHYDISHDGFVYYLCEDCKVIVPKEDVGDNLEAMMDRFHLEGQQNNFSWHRRRKRKKIPYRKQAEFLFSPLSNTTSVGDNLAYKVEPRRRKHTTTLPRILDFTFSPLDLTCAGSQVLVVYLHKKRGIFSTNEKL